MEYQLHDGALAVTISDLGAEMRSIQWQGREYLWQGDPVYWDERSPLLFPFVGRLTNNSYIFRQKTYPLTIHGFAKASVFTVTKQDDRSITLRLTDSEATLAAYPFRFELSVTYTIGDARIDVSYDVENRSKDTMYFGIGGHPGFQVPLEDGLTFDDYCLEFAAPHTPARVGHTESYYLSGVDTTFHLEDNIRLPLSHTLFDDDAIVLKNVADAVTLRSDKGSRSVTVRYPDLPYLGLWHAPKTTAPYLCIEPWSSLPSRQDIVEDFSYKSDLIRLKEGKTHHVLWQIELT